MTIKQREIALIPFPFTDLSKKKMRPVLILSNKDYHSVNDDVLCCAVTSNPGKFKEGVELKDADFDKGKLPLASVVMPCKLFTTHKNQIIKIYGRLNIKKSEAVINLLNLRIKIDTT